MLRSTIVDTSVLVSAFLFPDSVPGRVVALAEEGAYALHFSPIILEELRRSLCNPRLRNAYSYSDANPGTEAPGLCVPAGDRSPRWMPWFQAGRGS